MTMMKRCKGPLLTAVAVLVAVATVRNAAAQNAMPFSETYRRPSVSPYTMLGGTGLNGNNNIGQPGFNTGVNPLVYQQLIQPRVEQEQQFISQMQQRRQITSLQNRVQQIQRDTTAKQVNEQIRATGHVSTYQNLSHYYQR